MSAVTVPLESESTDSPFSALLKKWRKLRRCSQLSLAVDAEVSQRHVSFLESGRARPSREMVLSLAEALAMPLRERNLLLSAAGYAPMFKERHLNNEEMSAINHALELTLKHHDPYPAIVVDRNWNLLMSNDSAQNLIRAIGEPEDVWQQVDPSGDKNTYRMTFSPYGFRPHIANWEQFSKGLLIRLQREVSADPSNTYLSDLLEEACDTIGEPIVTKEGPIAPVLPMEMNLAGLKLKTFSMISSFGTAQDVTAEEIKVETFYPADDFTRQFFERMAKQS